MKAVTVVTERIEDDLNTTYINESILNRIIITEFTKTFLTKQIDDEIRRALKNIAYFDYHRFLDNKKTLVTGFI